MGVHTRLQDEINAFNRMSQSPELVQVDTGLVHMAYHGVRIGDEIDLHLAQVAAAFYAVGEAIPVMGPPGPNGALVPNWVIDDAALDAELARWNERAPYEFGTCGAMRPAAPDGRSAFERFIQEPPDVAGGFAAPPPPPEDHCGQVRGPDGQWYTIATRPPPDAPVLATSPQAPVDFGNPDFHTIWTARGILQGQASDSPLRHAPPGAYDHVGWGPDGRLVVGLDAGANLPPGPRPPLENIDPPPMPAAPAPPGGAPAPGVDRPAGPAVGGGAELAQGVFAGLAQAADERHAGVYQTQTNFYVDPQTGEHVAVVDAAHVLYDEGGDVLVVPGRMDFADPGRPEFVPLDVLYPPGPEPSMSAPNVITIPAEEDD